MALRHHEMEFFGQDALEVRFGSARVLSPDGAAMSRDGPPCPRLAVELGAPVERMNALA